MIQSRASKDCFDLSTQTSNFRKSGYSSTLGERMGHSPSPPESRPNGEVQLETEAPGAEAGEENTTADASRIEEGGANSSAASNSLWTSLLSSTLGVFDARAGSKGGTMQWTASVRRAMGSVPVRRIQECLLGGFRGGNGLTPGATVWLLGVCYRLQKTDEAPDEATSTEAEFLLDFSSRIWITYRQGFESIGESKLTNDVGWGCMIRTGQMLFAQALVCHRLGRAWRRGEKPYGREYVEILQTFADSPDPTCWFSIHNLIKAGSPYELAAGAWLGPYALCHAISALVRQHTQNTGGVQPLSVYVLSEDASGERGGAPVLCSDDVAGLAPVLILVPLVLGLDKVNPRYLPSLRATFTFPQSVGIAGGKPAASVYLVGVQDDQALYLDPHEVQKVVSVSKDIAEVDTSSYHCSTVRRMPLEAIDPSLALGFYCRNKEEVEDLCERASELAEQSNGAPMFTVAKKGAKTKTEGESCEVSLENLSLGTDSLSEEDWQIL